VGGRGRDMKKQDKENFILLKKKYFFTIILND
jgi:hypothetical protein